MQRRLFSILALVACALAAALTTTDSRAQERIHDGMTQHIGIAVPVKTPFIRYLNSTQYQFSAGGETVNIVTYTDSHLNKKSKIINQSDEL